MGIVALILGAFLYAQITAPESLLGAMAEMEPTALYKGTQPGPGGFLHVSWNDVDLAGYAAAEAQPSQATVEEILGLLVKVQKGKSDGLEATQEAGKADEADPQNLVVRIAHAVILDLAANPRGVATSAPAAPSIVDRYEAMQAIIQAPPQASYATLYNGESLTSWGQVLRQYMLRPDVAV